MLAAASLVVPLACSLAQAPPNRRAAHHEVSGLTREREGAWKGPFFFIQLTDPQLGMIRENQAWGDEIRLVRRAVERINRLKPRFVAVTGDMTNSGPGSPLYQRQVRDYWKALADLDPSIPLLHVPGNHDLGNTPSVKSLKAYRGAFGDDYYRFWVGGVLCLALDTSLLGYPADAPGDAAAQEAWLSRALKEARVAHPARLLVFQHYPVYLKDLAEDDSYHVVPKARRVRLMDQFRAAGVNAIFTGHLHHNLEARAGDMEMVSSSALGKPLGSDPSGLRIVEVYRDHLTSHFYGLDDVPGLPPTLRGGSLGR
jgi:3',5'-cyclic AMP phosphodiesterase CpdA